MTLTQLSAELQPKKEVFWANIFKRFAWMYAITAILLALIIGYAYQQYTQNLEDKMLSQEQAFVSSTTQALQQEMQTQLKILQMVTRSKALSSFMENGDPTSQQGLEKLFINLAITFHRYDQIRLIDMQGNEAIRMNYHTDDAHIVATKNLQNKHYSKYFQEGIKLSKGQVYVSPMELNVEYGEIEIPYKPVVRFVTPIINDKGEKLGLMVMNYLSTELLQNFRDQMELRISGQGMLIDPDGHWMSNHDRSNEWGGSLEDIDQKFENLYPSAWPMIDSNEEGILKSKKGIFRYVSIKPFSLNSIGKYVAEQDINLSVTQQSIANNDWKLVIFLPNETIREQSFFFTTFGQFTVTFIFLGSAAILFLILLSSEQKRRQQRQDLLIKNELSDLYENSPCGYHSLDKHGIVLKINQTELNWLGYSRQEVIGKHFSDFLTAKSTGVFDAFLAQLQHDKSVEGVVLEIQCKNGHTFFVSTSATSILEKGHFAIARTSTFDITDRIKLEERLAYIANTDVLTGISNRRHFFLQANERLKQDTEISVLMLDADHFKRVNDVYGHDVGDDVLKMIASTLRSILPKEVILARLGGEEFVILASDLSAEKAFKLSQKICIVMENTPIPVNNKADINITLSIGTAQRIAYDEEIDEILKRADIALYQAKTTGRNKAIQSSELLPI